MSPNTKVSLVIVAVVVAVVGAVVAFTRLGQDAPPAAQTGQDTPAAAELLVRPDSHRLSTAADGKVTVVEFLDLECEACGAAFPGVEQLRAEYGDQQVSHRETFRGFARGLGRDMATFDAALDDPATLARVVKDRDDGVALGVSGTPRFFVNGRKFDDPPSYDALKADIEQELAR